MQISGSPSRGPLEAVPPTASWGRCGVGVLSRRLSGAGCFHSLALQHSSLHSLAREVSYSAACVCSLLPRLPPCAFAAPLLPQTRSARSEGDMGFPPVPEASGQRWGPVLLAFFLAASQGLVTAFKVATPYSLYVCPEGQNVTLACRILGPIAKGHDVTFYKTWFRSVRGEVQACSSRRPIRNLTFQNLHLHHGSHQVANTSQDLVRHHGLESISDHHGNFSITMLNLTLLDSGLYCCLVVEIKHHHSEQRVHGAMELQVQRGEEAPSKCIAYPASPRESESITAAALATGACIVGILCLPLILLLVYKQRQVTSNRRAQELVRMDSGNAQGLDNPGYEVSPAPHGMPEAKPRPPLSYVAQRQPSESGRHLLSEPSTPLSPPGPGDVFFPSLDPVPDSPNSEAV